ncbi:hypothetical protein, partial [Pseudacidovorax sp. 1753]|uniref:hypothetical protein n=1 Tax=Pseudacidovorax sp. 1753 TaxID=3156419 RepID=UPI00339700CD
TRNTQQLLTSLLCVEPSIMTRFFLKAQLLFFTQKPPPLSQTPHQPNSATKGCVSVSELASIRGFSPGNQAADKFFVLPDRVPN